MSTIHQRALLLAILACCMFGCSKFLDDPQSSTSLPVEAAFQNGQDLEEALTGVYDLCQNGHLYGRNFIVLPELIGGNAVFYGGGFFGLEYVSALNMTATDWYAEKQLADGLRGNQPTQRRFGIFARYPQFRCCTQQQPG